MAALRNLESQFPIIDANVRRLYAENVILSVEDFIVHDFAKLDALAEVEGNSEVLKEIFAIIDGQHRPWLNGEELFEDAVRSKRFLPTGYESLVVSQQSLQSQSNITNLIQKASAITTQ